MLSPPYVHHEKGAWGGTFPDFPRLAMLEDGVFRDC